LLTSGNGAYRVTTGWLHARFYIDGQMCDFPHLKKIAAFQRLNLFEKHLLGATAKRTQYFVVNNPLTFTIQ
jgi:hypothetical protein